MIKSKGSGWDSHSGFVHFFWRITCRRCRENPSLKLPKPWEIGGVLQFPDFQTFCILLKKKKKIDAHPECHPRTQPIRILPFKALPSPVASAKISRFSILGISEASKGLVLHVIHQFDAHIQHETAGKNGSYPYLETQYSVNVWLNHVFMV